MNYSDCITAAIQCAEWEMPCHLLPLTISDEAAKLAGLDSDRMGTRTSD